MYLSDRRTINITPSLNVYHNPFDQRTITIPQSNKKYISLRAIHVTHNFDSAYQPTRQTMTEIQLETACVSNCDHKNTTIKN